MPGAEDWMAIHTLLGRYAQCWDEFDLDGFAGLFARDAEADFGGTLLQGPEAIRRFHEGRIGAFRAAGIQRRHHLGSIVIEAEGPDRAAATLYGQVFSTDRHTGITTVLPPVRYRGRFARGPDARWRITLWAARPDLPFPGTG